MAEFNPFGQMLESRMASDQFGLKKSQNAMQQQRQDRQMQMQDREIQQLDQSQQMEFAKTLGPIAAEMATHPPELQAEQWSKLQPVMNKFMPQALEGMGPDFTPQVQQAIAGLAQWHNANQPQPKPYEGLSQGYETYLRANQIPNSPEAYKAFQDNILAQKKAGATKVNVGAMKDTPGRKKTDEAFASEYVDWNASGGYADVEKQLVQLDEVVKSLGSGKELTGPITGSIPDFIQKFTNPDAIATRDAVEEVVQRNLRLILGAQFTENEGKRLIARAYNPNLSEKENQKRVKRLIGQIRSAARAKESSSKYWEKNGTLTGWSGKTYTMDDFMKVNPAVKGEEEAKGGIKFLGFE